jgi:hypothetical protein
VKEIPINTDTLNYENVDDNQLEQVQLSADLDETLNHQSSDLEANESAEIVADEQRVLNCAQSTIHIV